MPEIVDLRKVRENRAFNKTLQYMRSCRGKLAWLKMAAMKVVFSAHVFAAAESERDVIRIIVHPADASDRFVGLVELTREQWRSLSASVEDAWASAARIRNP